MPLLHVHDTRTQIPVFSDSAKPAAQALQAALPLCTHVAPVAGTPFGQHFAMAATESPMAEYWLGTDPGVPLEETAGIPGTAVPVNGEIVPSTAPGFGIEIGANDISSWEAN